MAASARGTLPGRGEQIRAALDRGDSAEVKKLAGQESKAILEKATKGGAPVMVAGLDECTGLCLRLFAAGRKDEAPVCRTVGMPATM